MEDPNRPLFSLLNGEGAGALLAAAAGDVAGGLDQGAYSSLTQVSTVVAYHLLRVGTIDRDRLQEELLEMDGVHEGEPSVYRAVSPELRYWLDSAAAGEAAPWPEPSLEPATRMAPVGVWFRRQPEALVEAAVAAARITHLDASTAVAAAAVAGAVAAGCFAQAGRDLLVAAAETAQQAAAAVVADAYRFGDPERAAQVPTAIRSLTSLVAADPAEVMQAASTLPVPPGVREALAAICLAAPMDREPFRLIEAGARLAGSHGGVIVGAVVGARVGVRRWPWLVPNDTWFAELGRRLVSRHTEVRDLPVPFAVEERLTHGGGAGYSGS